MITSAAFRQFNAASRANVFQRSAHGASILRAPAVALTSWRGLHASTQTLAESKAKKSSTKETASKKKKSDEPKKSETKEKKFVSALDKKALPKNHQSAWMLFNHKYCQKVKAATPEGEKMPQATQLAQEASKAYKQLTPDEMEDLKREWQVKHDQYKKALQNVTDQLSSLDIKNENKYRTAQRKAGKSRKGNLIDPSKPKHPRSAYLQYYIEQIASPEWSGQPVTNVSKLVAEQWRDLNDDEKSKYVKRAEQDKARFYKEKEQWLRETGQA